MIVALFHFNTSGFITNVAFVTHGWIFVDFFFVLSGFVIASAYEKKLEAGFSQWKFMGLRLGRIYPLHFFVLALLVTQEIALVIFGGGALTNREAFSGAHSPWALLTNISLLHAAGFHDHLTWNEPSWSIAAEIWAYALFASIVALGVRHLRRTFAVVAIASLGILLLTPMGLASTYDFGIVRCFYGFSLGVLIKPLAERKIIKRFATLIELAIIAICIIVVSHSEHYTAFIDPLVFSLTIVIFASEAGGISKLLCTSPMLLLGAASYSIYMIHPIVQGRFVDVLQVAGKLTDLGVVQVGDGASDRIVMAPDLATLTMLAVVIMCALITHRFIEIPARKWSRRVIMGGNSKQVAAVAESSVASKASP